MKPTVSGMGGDGDEALQRPFPSPIYTKFDPVMHPTMALKMGDLNLPFT